MKKKIINLVLLCSTALLIGACGGNDQKKDVKKENDAKTETTVKKVELSDAEKQVINSTDNFSDFVIKYKELQPDERSNIWDNGLYKKKVSWNGTIIGVGDTVVYLIDNTKYQQGMTFDNVQGTENEYYVFAAKFNDKILKDAFAVGSQETFTGNLESRGNDNNPVGLWKLYNAHRGV